MMASNIFAQYIQPIRSVQDYSNELARGDFIEGQNALQQSTMRRQQQADAAAARRSNAMQQLLSGAADEDTVIQRLLGSGDVELVTQGQALDMSRQKRSKEGADTGKAQAEAEAKRAETKWKEVDRLAQDLVFVKTPEDVATYVQRGAQVMGLSPEQTQQAVQRAMSYPSVEAYVADAQKRAIPLVKQFEEQAAMARSRLTADTQVQTTRMNNDTSRANNAATVGATIRGQNLTDARSKEANASAAATGKAPPGYRFKPDGSLEAIPGGPADIKAGELGAKREKSQQAALAQADRIITTVDSALKKVGYSTSGVGSVVAGVPGTTARDLKSELETVKANLGFAELQAMREASPTGGALGAIAVQELTALQSTVASLDQGQSPPQLQQSLKKIRGHLQKLKEVNGGSTGGASGSFDAPVDGWKVEKQ
jgi:hypothetical protein